MPTLRPFRHPRTHRQSIIINAQQSFMEQVLWPEFNELNAALIAYLSEITAQVIREKMHKETGEAEEGDESNKVRVMTNGMVFCPTSRLRHQLQNEANYHCSWPQMTSFRQNDAKRLNTRKSTALPRSMGHAVPISRPRKQEATMTPKTHIYA